MKSMLCLRAPRHLTAPKGRVLPIKDRVPFAKLETDRTNLALLVDAEFVTPEDWKKCHSAVAAYGATPRAGWKATRPQPHFCMQRVFAVEETPDWLNFRTSSSHELFTVDSFIPPHIQILADATHIIDHRIANGAHGVCLFVAAEHHVPYTKAFATTAPNGGWCWIVASSDGKVTAGEVERV